MEVTASECDNPWMRCMRAGEVEAAWRISDAVLRERAGQPCWHWPSHQQYIWDGAPLEGKRVLVRCYHGLGDQFIRFAPLLRRVARDVIVWAQPPLLPLLSAIEGIDQLLPLHEGAPEVDDDADVELMELPLMFRTTLATLPASVPYLRIEHAVPEAAARPRIGMVGRAGEWNDARSVPAALMTRLGEEVDAEIVVLQDRTRAAEWPSGCGQLVCLEPVRALARAIAGPHLLISVDTLATHLGGALPWRPGRCCRRGPTGAGWKAGKTAHGIRRCGGGGSRKQASGNRSSSGCGASCVRPHLRGSAPVEK